MDGVSAREIMKGVKGDRLLKTLGIKTNDLNLIRVDAKRAQVSS